MHQELQRLSRSDDSPNQERCLPAALYCVALVAVVILVPRGLPLLPSVADELPQPVRGRTPQQEVDEGPHRQVAAVFAVAVLVLDLRLARPAQPEAVNDGGDSPWHARRDQGRLQVRGPGVPRRRGRLMEDLGVV